MLLILEISFSVYNLLALSILLSSVFIFELEYVLSVRISVSLILVPTLISPASIVVPFSSVHIKWLSVFILISVIDIPFSTKIVSVCVVPSFAVHSNTTSMPPSTSVVDLIVQFALRDMLCKYLDFDSNILVCDELFDGLDSIGCNKVVDLIANLTNITSIYIVSHRQDLSLPVDRNLTIVKDARGISSIQNM